MTGAAFFLEADIPEKQSVITINMYFQKTMKIILFLLGNVLPAVSWAFTALLRAPTRNSTFTNSL